MEAGTKVAIRVWGVRWRLENSLFGRSREKSSSLVRPRDSRLGRPGPGIMVMLAFLFVAEIAAELTSPEALRARRAKKADFLAIFNNGCEYTTVCCYDI
jgi:hypothetical protein